MTYEDNEIEKLWTTLLSTDKYRVMIADITDNYPQKKSVKVDFEDITMQDVEFSAYLLEEPDRCLEIARKAVMELVPNIDRPGHTINVRIINLPRDAKIDIRNLRADHLGRLVAVEGLVRKVTTVKPRMTYALFRCARCGSEIWVPQTGMIMKEPLMCNNPDGSCNKQSTRFIEDLKASTYIDTQKIEIQERPEGLRGGSQPERLVGYVEDDIAGIVTAGNSITLNGVLRSVEKYERDKSTVFETYLDIISVEFEQHEYDEIIITEEDEEKILSMSKDPDLYQNIVRSIAPSIFGMDEQKKAIALQLFGGCHKEMDDGTNLRGDIHILLIGDPGVAKSQILRYMSSLAPRGIYASGKSASAAGLTAAAVRDDFGDGRWTLEAGALVLADKGLACIDELDKMTEQDTSSLHEAMEAQRISVAKAGINATLQCRCSMLAAANPKFGRFEAESSIYDQIDLPAPLVSRFDLIEILSDKPDKKHDQLLSSHILNTQRRGEARMLPEDSNVDGLDVSEILTQTDSLKPVYPIEVMRKYVAYSKRIVPIMTPVAQKIIQDSYLRIRGMGSEGSVPITARQLEGYVRLSEASARMRLSHTVTDQDANNAAELIEAYLNKIAGNGDGTYDIDKITSGVTSRDRNKKDAVLNIMREYGEDGLTIDLIVQYGLNMGLSSIDVEHALKTLNDVGDVYKSPAGVYKLTS
ncbi:MAG: minichromosome maintenance protein MCM [Candidatus Methanomethylophilaceae archaeon]|nr:minichromosome maintenance protein MCM [Candidatus Methanomethylophilaceae archaeon]